MLIIHPQEKPIKCDDKIFFRQSPKDLMDGEINDFRKK